MTIKPQTSRETHDLVSIYTPTYNTGELIYKAYDSIKKQTYTSWEWIICDDGSNPKTRKFLAKIAAEDKRVKVFYFENCSNIGKMKKRCTERCNGEYLLELDHDDRLTHNCLREVVRKFRINTQAGMVYSNFTEVTDEGECNTYNVPYWRYRDTLYDGMLYKEACAPDIYSSEKELSGDNIMHWALMPNHVRAFRSSEFFRVGGYDDSLIYADDYDLIIRLYLYSKIVHIPKMLYIYRWGNNTWRDKNEDLQKKMSEVRSRYFSYRCLDLGCGPNKAAGFEGVDCYPYKGVDHVVDFEKEGLEKIEESSIDELRTIDFIEHISDKVFTLEQIYRALKHNATVYIQVPSTDGRGAFQDPTHKSYWNENSFLDMYMNGHFRYGAKYNFKVISLKTTPLDDQHVCWVQVLLKADKSPGSLEKD